MNRPSGKELRQHWILDPAVRYLNHGSFGASPRAVLEHQRQLRDRMEAEPVRFFVREYDELLTSARTRVGEFVGAAPDTLAFVPNASSGVNTVVRSLEFSPGDELVTTDHEYRACRNALGYVAQRAGAVVVVAKVPFPLESPDQVVDAVLQCVTPRTRLALIDHVTSQTGLVLPIGRLVSELAARGVDTLVDGAHGPGMVDVRIEEIGAAYYTANCHKWLCAPKGAAFLYVRPDRRDRIHPLCISHGATWPTGERTRFRLEFDWTGTDDPTAHLAVPFALDHLAGLIPGGWPALRERNRRLALAARELLCRRLGIAPPCPDSMIGSLASLPIPDGDMSVPRSPLYTDPLQDELLFRHGLEVPVVPWPGPPKRLLRISCQLYNDLDDYEALSEALLEALPPRPR
ncbi:MAG: aminotransferase class V-fold PLP-dependent enzyme [Candidatus Riflebacteria bacterium]|nr:aminotransferase class V-fold PLP-dependent enzyme [Candidatus Riflebacteria bacterium]